MSQKILYQKLEQLPDEKEGPEVIVTEKNAPILVTDFTIEIETRLEALNLYFTLLGWENTMELVTRIIGMFEISGLSSLKTYLYRIGTEAKIDPFIRSTISPVLIKNNKDEELGYHIILDVYPLLNDTIGTPYKLDLLKTLMNNGKYKNQAVLWFTDFLNNRQIDSRYKWNCIFSLETQLEDKTNLQFYQKEFCSTYFFDEENKLENRSLAGQKLLTLLSGIEKTQIERKLYLIAKNNETPYNIRADLSDMLIRFGSTLYKEKAEKLIKKLGRTTDSHKGLYGNAQNVHNEKIEKSVQEGIEYLEHIPHLARGLTYEKVEGEIKAFMDEEKIPPFNRENILASMDRIYMDAGLYSVYNRKLSRILVKVWAYACAHKNEREIKKRLIEELREMAGTCSSGYLSRMVNTLSGFGDFSLKISWEDQIYGNISGRLNKRIHELDNLELQEKILAELPLRTDDPDLRKNFLEYFGKVISEIKVEMYPEFQSYLSEVDFDLYFRKAMCKYEIGEY